MSARLSQSEFEDRAVAFIKQQTGCDGAAIGPDIDLLASGIVDSLLLVELFFFLEELAGRDIPSENVKPERITTLSGAYELLCEHMSETTR